MKKYTIQYEANEEDITMLLKLDIDVFDKKDSIDISSLKNWIKVNKDIYTILKYDNVPVGYINFTAVTKECYDKFRIGKNKDYILTEKDILPFKTGDNYCLFTSIVIKKEHRDNKAIVKLWKGFYNKVKRLNRQGKKISSVIIDCVSIDGVKIALNNLRAKYICNSLGWGKIYEGKVFRKSTRFPKIKLQQLNKNNLNTIAKIQYEIFKDSSGVGYADYLEELKNNNKVGDDYAISYLIYYKRKPVGIIGLIKFAKYPNDIFLNWFGVLEKYRNRGIGTSALFKVIQMARSYDVKNFRLFSYILWHKVAQNIYRKTMQREENYFHKNDAKVLEKQGECSVFSVSLVDKVVPKWNNKFLNLKGDIELHKKSVEKLKEDGLIDN